MDETLLNIRLASVNGAFTGHCCVNGSDNVVVALIATRNKNQTVLVRQPLIEVIHACIAI